MKINKRHNDVRAAARLVSCIMAHAMVFLFLGSCARSQETLRINDIAVYQSLGVKGATALQELEGAGVVEAEVVYGQHFLTSDHLSLDETKLKARINKVIPEQKSRGLIVLDWEGPRMQQLLGGAADRTQKHLKAVDEYLKAYRVVKEMRPNATVGFYGFPERNYWKRDEGWRARNDALTDFLREVDAIFPSIYDFYLTTDKNRTQEQAYARENTREAIRLGQELGKPVYPFVWHRYHESNKSLKRQLIPEAEFQEHVSAIAQATYQGQKIDGVIWWSSEQYFYNLAKKKGGKTTSFDESVAMPTLRYFETLQRALRE